MFYNDKIEAELAEDDFCCFYKSNFYFSVSVNSLLYWIKHKGLQPELKGENDPE